ncbi:MAG: TIGR03619 family F420-dependent LLM class oxidoreductase [Acetobacteraceae bacterium]|nr:TIGR03619 family F420-dependent LLM class oxidoreductase [Pseudomonadota bacterium]
MLFGSPLPITAFAEVAAIRNYAVSLEQAGFDFTSTAGHVLAQPEGTNPQRPPRQYTGPFYDPFVTFGYLSAITSRLRFISAILILPAWPTALVAKQAAELALFSGGRFELGVGISWNAAEYQALGQPFHGRGMRMEEQIAVLRRLWAEDYVSFTGQHHTLDKVGLHRGTLPPIPIWFGTETGERALRRTARLADGWMSLGDATAELPRLLQYVREAGRDPVGFKVRVPLAVGDDGPAAWSATVKRYKAAGVTHINVTPPPGLDAAAGLARVVEALPVVRDAANG